MRKTRIVKKEETVLFCDVCGKKIQNYTSCSICYRELCDNCSKDMEFTSSMWYSPCPICFKLKDKYFKEIQKYFSESEVLRDKGIDLLNMWKKESLELKSED